MGKVNKKVIITSIFAIALIVFSLTGCQAKTTNNKDSEVLDLNKYMESYCKRVEDGPGVKPDKDQPYCLVGNRLDYIEYAENWDKAITKSVYYAKKHNKKVVKLGLIVKDFSKEQRAYIHKAAKAHKNMNSEIKMMITESALYEVKQELKN